MLRQAFPFALKLAQSNEQGCAKLLSTAAVSGRSYASASGAEAQEAAAVDLKVAQYSSAEAAAMASKKQHITGLGGLSLKSTKAMGTFASGKAFSSSAAPAVAAAAAEPAKETATFFGRMMKAAAALVAAVALALAPPALADAPGPWQWGFQDTATSTAQAAIDLHHDIMFFVITIATLVLYMTFQIATKFHYTRNPVAEKLTHHTTLEVLWTVFPTLVVLFIGIPSLTLIYSMDQHNDRPGLTVKVIGRQWYWSYEMHDHLQHKLVDPDRLVAIAEKSLKA